jgi:hypothetical protein
LYTELEMRRNVLIGFVVLGALSLGVISILRGQVALGVCFLLLAALRGALLFQRMRPSKPQPSIRLNLDGDATDSGSDGHGS